jgi:hypothetical protein
MMPALLLSAALAAPAARADMYDVTVSGADTGSLVITESSGNISVVTGTFDGSTVDSLLPTDSIGGNDNTFPHPRRISTLTASRFRSIPRIPMDLKT